MVKRRYEKDSLADALLAYLQERRWNITKIDKKFDVDEGIVPPYVSVYFLPSRPQERQLGKTFKSFARQVQVDVYMEDENRVDAILDDIADFMDEVSINVTDPNGTLLGHMICYDTESIVIDTPPLVATNPQVIKWRGVAKCNYDVDYIV